MLLLLGLTSRMDAQSAGCNRAQAIVDEVKAQYESGHPDHQAVLTKLKTAQQLCPTMGDAWKYAHCSALALGDAASADRFKTRALFNNVSDLSCGLAGPVAASPMPSFVRQKYALVIGIGNFRDPEIPKLKFAAKDARDFARVLTEPLHGNFPPENVTLLTDEKATREAILNALQELILRVKPEDLVVVYVSSHGSPSKENKGLGGIGHIVTYDTKLERIWVDAIEYQDFAAKTSLIPARRKVAFLDTCFSGQASRTGAKLLSIEGVGVNDQTAKLFLSGEGTFVITSSKFDERSWESDSIQNSYFTFYLMDALTRSKDEPPTVKDVFQYLSSKVSAAVAKDKNQPQHPQMQPSTGPGDVRIGVMPRGDGNS
ncbi:MAG: caspase family protein [Acidobacteriota bacterium]